MQTSNHIELQIKLEIWPDRGVRSSQQIENALNQASVCTALKSAHFHFYKITLTQKLHINDYARILTYCWSFLNVSEKNYHFSKYILFSDECIFHNNGNINRHNLHYPGPPRILSGCSKSDGRWTFERVFLETTSLGYISLMVRSMAKSIENFFKTILSTCSKRYHWNHILTCSSNRMAILHTLSRRQKCYWIRKLLIILRGSHEWSSRLPDLTPLDFFLWGHLKQQVYATRPR